MFEEIETKKKHSALFTILGIFVLVAAIGGVAVAAYTWTFTSGNANTIGTGNISMSLLESNDVINIPNALPTTDNTGKSYGTDKSFDFSVTTSASGAPGNIAYTISLTKLTATEGYTRLPDANVKVYLTAVENGNETVVVSPTLMSAIITSGDTGVLTFDSGKTSYLTHVHTTVNQSKTTKYRLRMWVDYNTDASSWTSATKNEYKLKIAVSGSLTA